MIFEEDLTNQKVVVRDMNTGETLEDTYIRYYDKHFDVIRISATNLSDEFHPKVNLLIFTSTGMRKCSGTVRGNGSNGAVDIALYNGLEEDDRRAVRYTLSMPGMIMKIKRPNETKAIEESFAITVLNMSTTGFLFRAPAGMLQKGDVVKISCMLKGHRMVLQGEIIRVQNEFVQDAEYGCKLFTIQNK